jgi:hypothetical protein
MTQYGQERKLFMLDNYNSVTLVHDNASMENQQIVNG